jgi:hypothetical protein
VAKFKLIFDCESAAFSALDDGKVYTETRTQEIENVLRRLAMELADGRMVYIREAIPIRDSNGLVIGTAQLTGLR